jgi:AcrR family transcriptional regulator
MSGRKQNIQAVTVLDPRAKRTRQLLAEAFRDLMGVQEFGSITVQDIARKATVNRATFYAHFDDKFALLDWIIRDQFRSGVLIGLEHFEPSPDAVRRLISVTGTFLAEFGGQCPEKNREFHPLVEAIIQDEIHAYVLQGLPTKRQETAATILSWSIFGAAREWSRGTHTKPIEKTAERAVDLLTNGVL